MSTKVGEIYLGLGIDTKKAKSALAVFSKDAKAEARRIENAFSGIGTAVAAGLSLRAIVNFSKECINLGSDLSEVQNVVDVTFGDGASTINAWAQTTKTAFGLSELSAKQYAGTMGAMLKSTGIANDAAMEMSTTLAELAGDMASFYNLDTDEAFAKIRSGISGETEPLKQLGINLSVANLEAYALSKGITKSYNAMSQAEQVLLRYNYLMQTTADAQGDFSRTAGSWANQVRVLQLNLESIKATLGQAFINVLTPCLQILNELLGKLQLVAQAILDLSVILFGDAGGGASSGSSAAVTASEAIADNTASAAKSAKSYAKSLAGFDKLNIIGGSKSGSGGSGGGSGSVSGLTPSGSGTAGGGSGYDTKAMQNTLGEIAAIVGVAALALGAVLTFTGINIPLGVSLMAIGAASLYTARKIDEKAIVTPVTTGLDLVAAALSGAALVLGAVLAFTGVNIKLGLALLAVGAVGMATVAALNWDSMPNGVKTAVTTIASVVGGGLLALGAVMAFTGAMIPLGIAFMVAGAVSLGSAIALNWNSIPNSIDTTVGIIGGVVGGALLALGALLCFTGVAIPLGLGMMAAGGVSLAAAIAPNWDFIVKKIGEICGKIGGIFSGLWTGIKDGFRNAVNGIIGFANKWINGLNYLLTPVRDLIVGISGAFGKNISIDDVKLPNIPALANGGYVKANTPQLAMIGDNRHQGEIVAPEGKITEAVTAALGPFVEVLRQLGASIQAMKSGNGQNIVVKCYLDGKVVYETVVKEDRARKRQNGGKSPLTAT